MSFKTIHSDAGVYILHCHHKRGDSETDMILILYVDDLLLLGQDLSKIKDVKHQLGKLYQMKDLGPASSYLGIQITRDRKRRVIWIVDWPRSGSQTFRTRSEPDSEPGVQGSGSAEYLNPNLLAGSGSSRG